MHHRRRSVSVGGVFLRSTGDEEAGVGTVDQRVTEGEMRNTATDQL
jgi:hypothetical protein